ncbi:hypothetical protein GCM10017784_30170 [Deinococcus indicus]|uniref:hypothetical protein n=1 Tax=Deinococcus indicus TaxID=223556 RepID=UPI00174DAECC|nr:hypothetical protein [Deinococcus indicus]GHG34382.1 hypothetical protein GCM10017784_30170 [Deinococcus indicus]
MTQTAPFPPDSGHAAIERLAQSRGIGTAGQTLEQILANLLTSMLLPGTNAPLAPGSPAVGTSGRAAREDHVHPLPTPAQLGALSKSGDSITGNLWVSSGTTSYALHLGVGNDTNTSLRKAHDGSFGAAAFAGVATINGPVLHGFAGGALGTKQGASETITLRWGVNTIGFLGAAPIARPTITGSRGGNAALASLITQQAALGLVIDGTTP